MEDETVVDKIGWTRIKSTGVGSMMRVPYAFSVKLTNKAIYSYIFWVIPVGRVPLENVIGYRVLKNDLAGYNFVINGVVIKYKEKGKVREVAIELLRKKNTESFIESLKKVGLKEIK